MRFLILQSFRSGASAHTERIAKRLPGVLEPTELFFIIKLFLISSSHSIQERLYHSVIRDYLASDSAMWMLEVRPH